MRTAYLECASGISGDMCLGALIDAGASFETLQDELKKIPISGYTLKKDTVNKSGIEAIKITVEIEERQSSKAAERQQQNITVETHDEAHHSRRWQDIQEIISGSLLKDQLKEKILKIFRLLFEAEAKVHGVPLEKAHLHELGAVDCIVDIAGAVICLDMLKIDRVFASPVNTGAGTVKTSHGVLPVPAPATLELLTGIPIYSGDIQKELTTPTGAAILKAVSSGFAPMPVMTLNNVGVGAGAMDLKDRPNVLRVFIGDTEDSEDNTVTLIETNIDDMNPQIYEYLMERLFDAGALDVYLTQVIMKKSRPGILLSVISKIGDRDILSEIIFKETTTIGLRYVDMNRKTLRREIADIETPYGTIKAKTVYDGDKPLRTMPEYEDWKRAAKGRGAPIREVMEGARNGCKDGKKK